MKLIVTIILAFSCFAVFSQHILPTPQTTVKVEGTFEFQNSVNVFVEESGNPSFIYLKEKFPNQQFVSVQNKKNANLVFETIKADNIGDEGYFLKIHSEQIVISANTETGLFYGIQSLLHLLPAEKLDGHQQLAGTKLSCLEIEDSPKYAWRSFMLDSGRQYQTPDFIKQFLDRMAMLKMNVFHWHLTEGQGWRIEIKKYPKLTSIGSNVAKGKEQQGFYTQEEIKEIVAYAKKLHIEVVPEIDVPGHSEAALIAYPELTCFRKATETVMAFTPNLFCGGREETYTFLQNVLDEVCDLFPSEYIHLGGDEAPKANWNKCPDCQAKIKSEGLKNSHDLQLYFSKRLANYLNKKDRKVIFWGDVVYHDGTELPENVVVYWWNWRRHKDLALVNGLKRGHQVICGTNYYNYLNFPLSPWSKYAESRTFDMQDIYEKNPSDLENPDPLVLGMGTCLWTDWFVTESMTDKRVFPRAFATAEQMWHRGKRLTFDTFYIRVKSKYPLLKTMGIDYGPALKSEVPENYNWD